MTLFKTEASRHLTDGGSISREKLAGSHPGMAYFSGTGPNGKTCKNCIHHVDIAKKRDGTHQGRCIEFKRLCVKNIDAPKFPSHSPACKYFEPNGER